MGCKKSQKVKGWKGHGEERDPDMKGGERVEFLGSACPAGGMGNKLEIGGSAAARISERGVSEAGRRGGYLRWEWRGF